MKKLILKFIAMAVIFITLIFLENHFNDESLKYISVVIASKEIYEGEQIKEEMLEYIDIEKSILGNNLIKNIDDILGMYSNENIINNQFIYKHQFMDKTIYNIKKDNRLITIKFNIENSNGWNLSENQIVDLIMISDTDLSNIIIENVIVKKIFDDNLNEFKNSNSNKIIPQYVLFEVSEKQQNIYLNNCKFRNTYISIK